MKKQILSGNQAIALGAWEAGARVGTGYPGTPSTEILENFCLYDGVATEWSVNEKVALEVALGASLAGARCLVTMKHVGMNVAADPLFTSSYTGVKGGVVIACADDPDMHSSQNEQDNRHYARAAKLPMLEPCDSREARDFTKAAFDISERFDTPVILRSTTRLSHSMTVLEPGQREERPPVEGFKRDTKKYVMIPAYARMRHRIVEMRLEELAAFAEETELNRIEDGDRSRGFITSGVAYTYLREVFPDAAVLKLGMVHPLPKKLIRRFADMVDELIVIEELDPFFEEQIRAMGIKVAGKDRLPVTGEYTPDLIRTALGGSPPAPVAFAIKLPPRPPSLCPGCPHRTIFNILSDLKVTVTGDIGCYTLGVLPPFTAMDTCVDMGASVSMVQGIEMAMGDRYQGDAVGVIGDSTFAHSGLTGLLNAAYNKRHSLIIVLDNGTTAMTGMQPNPLSGRTINWEETTPLDYGKLGEAVGIAPEHVRIVNAFKKDAVETAVKELLATKSLALLVAKGPCIIAKRKDAKRAKKGS